MKTQLLMCCTSDFTMMSATGRQRAPMKTSNEGTRSKLKRRIARFLSPSIPEAVVCPSMRRVAQTTEYKAPVNRRLLTIHPATLKMANRVTRLMDRKMSRRMRRKMNRKMNWKMIRTSPLFGKMKSHLPQCTDT